MSLFGYLALACIWLFLGAQLFAGAVSAGPVNYAPLSDLGNLESTDVDGCLAAARQWLDTLPEGKREMAFMILSQSHPRADALRKALNEKKAQLANVRFNRDVAPETLPRLGLEVQELRRELRRELLIAHARLARDAYIILPPLPNDAVCLPLPPADVD